MKNSKKFLFLHFILFFNDELMDLCSCESINNNNKYNSKIRKLYSDECTIKNCLSCDNRNECIKCKDGFELSNKRCYSKNCEIYGFCRFCDEYDCLKCIKGYKLNYGICDTKNPSRKKFYISILLPLLIIIIVIYICFHYKRIIKHKIYTGKVIRFIHPKSGFYQLSYETKVDIPMDKTDNMFLEQIPKLNETIKTPIVNRCVVCGNKNTYCISQCGCSICMDHYKIIKMGKEIKCPIHNINITSKITFQMKERSKIRGNALEKFGLSKCPICKINNGTQSFNCGCAMRLCKKCFNDNVYILKYNQCPGCGLKYKPLKNMKKGHKGKEESIKN